MSNGDTSTSEQDGTKDESVTVTVQGVSADGTSETGDQPSVEARGNAGGEASEDSSLKTARELLQKMVRWVRKILRLDP